MVGATQAAVRAALAGLTLSAVPPLVLLAMLTGCSAYDPNKLPKPDALSPRAGSGGRGGSGGMGGSGTAGTGGASGVGGGDVTVVGCGDGTVAPTEKCDTKIAAGTMGACPTACPAVTMGTACVTRRLEGTACQAECVDLAGTCTNGDGCCSGPPCTSQNDDDCSASCGNGVVESQMGETCERPSMDGGVDAGVDAGVFCPSEADCDDDDPCTVDSVLGSAMTCNAQCLHTEIASAVDNDGCCPKGANSIADEDCPIDCGNGVVETGEECDGSDGCNDQCMVSYTDAQRDCLDKHVVKGSPDEECQKCGCIQCTDDVVACRGDSDDVVGA